MTKPVHVKPSIYALYYESLKIIAIEHGYNLLLNGSLNRDLDLVAVPWAHEVKDHEKMVDAFCECLGGKYCMQDVEGKMQKSAPNHHGRINYLVNILRLGSLSKPHEDAQYYLDISIFPPLKT